MRQPHHSVGPTMASLPIVKTGGATSGLSAALILSMLAGTPSPAVRLGSDALASVGGSQSSSTHRLGLTVGLPVVGIASTADRVEIAGFWHPQPFTPSSVVEPPVAVTLPLISGLNGIVPNPSSGRVRVTFRVAGAAKTAIPTRLDLFDLSGRRVATLVNAPLPPGVHTLDWSGADHRGASLAAGRYYLRFIAGSRRDSRSILVVR